ncbi:Hypothetical predicted protein [Mytilus galloprovincialis]|uniref:Reverse transcriptase domain-containing protein n=1 Tax=Mytilus galloprovincialis TaxID=29158 RepID=A0A8B6DXQ7_MYTGA|nr:Hypothetical predicted protein [Mytilus galloprovincialis]
MEGIHSVKDLIQKSDWMIKIDLTDAYLTVPVLKQHQNMSSFQWQGKTYQFQVLPFGISVAPLVFTKLMKVPASFLRRLGIRLVVYLDDILILNQSKREMSVRSTTYSKASSKFRISNKRKEISFCPISTNAFSRISSELGRYESVPSNPKIQKIQKLCKEVKNSVKITVKKLSELIGNLTASIQAIFPAPLHYRHLQVEKNQRLNQTLSYNSELVLSQKSSKRIKLVDTPVNSLEWGGLLISIQPSVIIQTDASNVGWGAVMNKVSIGGPWLQSEKSFHINALELIAVTHAVKSFLKDRHNLQVLIQTDNITTMTYINKMGGTVSKVCNKLALELWTWCLQKDIVLKADFIQVERI